MEKQANNLWREIKADLEEKSNSGYRMALIDSDKLLRQVLKDKGYPGKDLKKQLFWAGVNLNSRPELKKAINKKEEILNDFDYRLSSFEIEDFILAYRKAIEKVLNTGNLDLKKKIGLYLEGLDSINKFKIVILVLSVIFGIKFFTSTNMGKTIVEKVVGLDNFIFDWMKILLLIALVVIVVALASFVFFDKKKKIKIKE